MPDVSIPRNGKPLDLTALSAAVGAGLSSSPAVITVTDPGATVTAQQLQAAFTALTQAPPDTPVVRAVRNLDTSTVVDPAAKTALDALIAAVLAIASPAT